MAAMAAASSWSSSFSTMFESIGDTGEPCGHPSTLFSKTPSTIVPAFNDRAIRVTTRSSLIFRLISFRINPCGILSKKLLRSYLLQHAVETLAHDAVHHHRYSELSHFRRPGLRDLFPSGGLESVLTRLELRTNHFEQFLLPCSDSRNLSVFCSRFVSGGKPLTNCPPTMMMNV